MTSYAIDPEDVLALLREVFLSLHPESRTSAKQTLDEIGERYREQTG